MGGLSVLNVLKEKMEHLYEKKAEGKIIRSRARWHEHGEKNSKYFLNLEKRNHVRKHIRKLRLSGVISTDPFEILDAERTFYENPFINLQEMVPKEISLIFTLKTYLQHSLMIFLILVKD